MLLLWLRLLLWLMLLLWLRLLRLLRLLRPLLPPRRRLLRRRQPRLGLSTPRVSIRLALPQSSRRARADGLGLEMRGQRVRCRHSRVGILAPSSLSRRHHAGARHAGSPLSSSGRLLLSRQVLAGGWRGGWLAVELQLPSLSGHMGVGAWRGGRLDWSDGRALSCGCRLPCAASMRGGRHRRRNLWMHSLWTLSSGV